MAGITKTNEPANQSNVNEVKPDPLGAQGTSTYVATPRRLTKEMPSSHPNAHRVR